MHDASLSFSPFWKELAQGPFRVGAIAPSSHLLANLMTHNTRVGAATSIIELGCGDGAITSEIVRRKRPNADFLGIEKNPSFLPILRNRFPRVTFINACASELKGLAQKHLHSPPECILSTLPWALFSSSLQSRIISSASECLAKDGIFATAVCYGTHLLPSGRMLRHFLEANFRNVRISPVLFRNVPPVFVYYCTN